MAVRQPDPGLKALYSNNLTQIVQPVTRWLLNKRVSVQKIQRSVRSASNPGGGGYSHTLPTRVCAAQRGRDFEAPHLERSIRFRGVF